MPGMGDFKWACFCFMAMVGLRYACAFGAEMKSWFNSMKQPLTQQPDGDANSGGAGGMRLRRSLSKIGRRI